MGTEDVKHQNNAKKFSKHARKRRQVGKWKTVFDAVQNGDLEAVKYFIENQQIDVNSRTPGHSGSLLSTAAKEGHLSIVQYLVSRGADVNATDRYGYNSLLWVLDTNKASLDVIKFLVEKGADVNVKAKENGYSPLHWATINNRLDLVKYLVEKNADLNAQTKDGLTPFQIASQQGSTDIVVYLTNLKTGQVNDVFEAASQGDIDMVKFFVKSKGADPFMKSSNGDTALHKAAANGHLSVVKYLLELRSGNVNIRNTNGETPLISACARKHLHIVKYLIEDKQANPDAAERGGYTPLLIAARTGNLELVQYLVNLANVNVNTKDHDSNNVLQIAAQFDQLNIIMFLVDVKKLSIYLKNKHGDTALHIAAHYGRLNIVKYFIDEKGMDVTTSNNSGRNILHAAVEGGNLTMVQYLLNEKRADINMTDSNHDTVLHIAIQFNHLPIVKYLIEKENFNVNLQNRSGLNAMAIAQMSNRLEILNYFLYERRMTVSEVSATTAMNFVTRLNTKKPNVATKTPLVTSAPSYVSNNAANVIYLPNKNENGSKFNGMQPITSGGKIPAPPNSSYINEVNSQLNPSLNLSSIGQTSIQTSEQTITNGQNSYTHYFVNGQEVDKATRDKILSEYEKMIMANNGSPVVEHNKNQVTWGQSSKTDATGTHVTYTVNGQQVDQQHYEDVVNRFGGGNTSAVKSSSSGFSQSVPVLSQSVPVLSQSAPVLSQSAPVLSQSAPVLSQSAPGLSQSSPVFSQSAPVFSQSAPVFSQSAPVQYSWSDSGNIIPYYDSTGKRRKRSSFQSPVQHSNELNFSPISSTLSPLTSSSSSWLQSLNTELQTVKENRNTNSDNNSSFEVGASKENNFLTLLDFITRYITSNRYQQSKHESLLYPKEILENKIDHDAIKAVNGYYKF